MVRLLSFAVCGLCEEVGFLFNGIIGAKPPKMIYFGMVLVLLTKEFDFKVIENNTVTKLNYNPEELLTQLFNINTTIIPRQNGNRRLKFEGEQDHENFHKFVMFQDDNDASFPSAIKFQDDNELRPTAGDSNPVTFKDDDQQHPEPVQKKRRRRRRPRQQRPAGYPGPVNPSFQQNPGQGYPGQFGSQPGNHIPGYQGYPGQFGPQPPNYVPGYGIPQNRPPRRRPASPDALSSIITALTSIARYDDQQCVPRLLCEAAGGALGNSWVQSVAGLQPLLTLLSAYNGISASPLFIFGRAVFLGMTSKGNPSTCRYAYNTCPTDPEELVHYLNNHNGGFFRFFNAPQRPTGQQNLEQFYNQLSGQYGLLPVNYPVSPVGYGYAGLTGDVPQNYDLYYPAQNVGNSVSTYGQYGPSVPQNHVYNPQIQQNYGNRFPYDQYQYGLYNNRFKIPNNNGNRIQKRIQNKPNSINDIEDLDINGNTNKLTFPNKNYNNNYNDFSSSNQFFKFPQQNTNTYLNQQDYVPDVKGFQFPESQNYRPISILQNYPTSTSATNNNYITNNVFRPDNSNNNKYNPFNNYQNGNYMHNYNGNRYNNNNNHQANNAVRTVYVVRGNGDPNNPEVIMLRPGENVS